VVLYNVSLSQRPSEASQEEAVMAEALSRDEKLQRTLDEKREQGYVVESHNDQEAVLSMRGRRRFFNLRRGSEERYLLSFDEQGHARSRRIELAAG
jgi:hypothetical protein